MYTILLKKKLSKQLTFDTAIIAKVREVVEYGEIYIYLYSQLLRNETYIHSYISNKISVPEQAANIILFIPFSDKVCSKFSKEVPNPSQVVQKINMKCVEARRPPRARVLQTHSARSSE